MSNPILSRLQITGSLQPVNASLFQRTFTKRLAKKLPFVASFIFLSSLSLQTAAQYNYSLSFVKANSQYVTVPHSSSINFTTAFTMEAVVNYSGTSATIIDKGNYDYLWQLNANGNANKMGFYLRSSATWVYSNTAVPENTQTHVAITLNAGTLTFYINGVASGSAPAFTEQDNLPLNIGRQQPSSCQCNYFNGTMDELRLWNIVRTQAEIQANMTGSVPTNSAGLAAYYKFDEGSGTTTADASGNGNNGTLVNSPAFVLQVGPSSQAALVQVDNKLFGSGFTGVAQQGESLDISADGNTAVVGGAVDDGQRGAIWFYKKTGGTWQQEGGKITVGSAGFGTSVSLSADGNTAVIGSPDDNGGIGAAWVFVRAGGVWSQQGPKLVGSGFVGSPKQGESVAISADGNKIIIGAPKDNVNGAAWIFTRTGITWTQFNNKLVATGTVGPAATEFGGAVAMSGDGHTVMIGGIRDNADIGASWIFKDDGAGAAWQQKAKLVGNITVGTPVQGWSVSLSDDGTTAVTGGWADNNGVGAVWGFTTNGTSWSQYGPKQVIPGGEQMLLGYGVAISGDGNTLIAGAPNKLFASNLQGAAYTFLKSPDFHVGWILQTGNLSGSGSSGVISSQGWAVSISGDGNAAFLGGPADNDYTGAAWAFSRSGSIWSQVGSKIIGSGAINPTAQGKAVAISADGNTAVVGGLNYNNARGAVWVYTKTATGWTQTQQLTGATVNSLFGSSLSISGDGNTLFIGVPGDVSGKGSVKVFTRAGGIFTFQATLVGSPASNTANQGTSVSCSATGNSVIFGAPYADDVDGTGAAFIFTRTGTTWTQKTKLIGTASYTFAQAIGNSVAMSADGNTAIVGAQTAVQTSTDMFSSGAAYVFVLAGGNWSQQARLANGVLQSAFGSGVSLSADGTTAAVGAATNNSNQGGTWIFTRAGSTWSQQTILTPAGNIGAAGTGAAVALTAAGDRLLIGGPTDNGSVGATWLYNRSGSTWSQAGKLVGSGSSGAAGQGFSVGITPDGTTAISGGPGDNRGYGAAWIFVPRQNCNLPTTRIYVNAAATGANNGSSWADAYTDLQTALRAYRLCAGATEIWVAKGVYQPAEPGGDKTVSFMVPTGAKIYGGFAGTETAVTGRDLKLLRTLNRTTLSGDLNGDDGAAFSNRGDNSYSVVNITDGSITTIFSGFTVSGGNASAQSNGNGAGITVLRGDRVAINDCVISDNSAFNRGGGIYNESGIIYPTRVIFSDNRATEGAACYNYWKAGTAGNAHIFVSCAFINNTVPFGQGAAMYNYSDNSVNAGFTFYQCSFSGNIAAQGSIYNNRAGSGTLSNTLFNCAFYNNGGSGTLVNVHSGAGLPVISTTNSLFEAAVTGYTGTGTVITSTSPFVSATDLHIPCSSAALNAGAASPPPSARFDLDNNLRPAVTGTLPDIGAFEKQPTSTWLGYSTDWATAGNWTAAMVPDACTEVIVNSGVANMPVVSGVGNVCQKLTANNGAVVTVVTGAILNVLF